MLCRILIERYAEYQLSIYGSSEKQQPLGFLLFRIASWSLIFHKRECVSYTANAHCIVHYLYLLIRIGPGSHRDLRGAFVRGAICRVKLVTKVSSAVTLHSMARACRRRPLQEEGPSNQGSGAFCMLSHHQGGADPISANNLSVGGRQLPYRSPDSATMLAIGSVCLRKLPSMGAPCTLA